jgi:YaiO family outer membrane protein
MHKSITLLFAILILFPVFVPQVSAAKDNIYDREKYITPVYYYVLKKSKAFIEQGRHEKALIILSPFISEPLEYPDAVADYIATLVWNGHYSEAISKYEGLPGSFPDYTYLTRNMAKAYYETKNYKKALKLYRMVLGEISEDIEVKGMLLSLDQTGNNKALLFYLDKLRYRDAGNIGLELKRSTLLMKNGHYRNAFSLFHDVERKGFLNEDSLMKFYRDLGASLTESSDISIQNWLFNEAWRENVHALSDLVMILAAKGDYDAIIRNIEALNIDNDLIQINAEKWIAWAYFKSGNIEKAKLYYLSLSEKNPSDIRSKAGLAYCYAKEGNLIESYIILSDLEVDYPEDTNNLFSQHEVIAGEKIDYDSGLKKIVDHRKAREYHEAEDLLKKMLEQYPDNSELLRMLGQTLYWDKKYDESIDTYKKLKKLKPSQETREEMNKVINTRDDTYFRLKRNYLQVSTSYFDYTKGLDSERRYTIKLRERIAGKTFVAGYSNIDRFGKNDNQVMIDVYSSLGKKRWGYISLTASPDAEFLADWTAGFAVYHGYKKLDFSFGYTFMKFGSSSVHLLKPGLLAYLSHGFTLNETLFINPKKGTATLISRLEYKPNYRFNAYYSFSIGKSSEEIGALQDTEKNTTYSHGTGVEYRFKHYLSVGAAYKFSHREKIYDKQGFTLYAKYWWE